ncbi:hypothetical protein D3C87_929340 [compost metagenome]
MHTPGRTGPSRSGSGCASGCNPSWRSGRPSTPRRSAGCRPSPSPSIKTGGCRSCSGCRRRRTCSHPWRTGSPCPSTPRRVFARGCPPGPLPRRSCRRRFPSTSPCGSHSGPGPSRFPASSCSRNHSRHWAVSSRLACRVRGTGAPPFPPRPASCPWGRPSSSSARNRAFSRYRHRCSNRRRRIPAPSGATCGRGPSSPCSGRRRRASPCRRRNTHRSGLPHAAARSAPCRASRNSRRTRYCAACPSRVNS